MSVLIRPRGTRSRQGERSHRVGKVLKIFLIVGVILFGFQTQSIITEANSLSPVTYDDGIPADIRDYCEVIGAEYEICPELLEAIAYKESRFCPEVTNKKCYGLMQINVKVHADRIEKYGWTADDMFDKYKNITVAADYLKELYDTYGDDDPLILLYYSGDAKGIANYKEYSFLTDYVSDILTRSANYERIHGK